MTTYSQEELMWWIFGAVLFVSMMFWLVFALGSTRMICPFCKKVVEAGKWVLDKECQEESFTCYKCGAKYPAKKLLPLKRQTLETKKEES